MARSDDEWRKHLCAGGFRFPADRPPNYALVFRAGPDHPAVEHDLRAFLDVVDDELRRCRPVLDGCAPRWRDLPLPGGVDRRNIISNGYTYGEFRFELDREAVLELFTGERLYNDPYVFVRELLQNAIDATRLRAALRPGDPPGGVAVTCWEDGDGFLWVRVDDDGIGMDEHTLHQYFLRVGRSYYESAELRAALAHSGRDDGEFVAISRFGIGVLSCFIAGDRVELSTRRVGDAVPLRVSLAREEEFFVLREPPDRPEPMPRRGRDEEESGYRERPGTSIAVRIDPTRVDVSPKQVGERVDGYLMCPPVPVTFDGRPAGTPPADDLDRPLLPAPVTLSVWDHVDRLASHGDVPYWGPVLVGLAAVRGDRDAVAGGAGGLPGGLDGGAGGVGEREPTAQQTAHLIEVAREFVRRVNEAVRAETDAWRGEFDSRMGELEVGLQNRPTPIA